MNNQNGIMNLMIILKFSKTALNLSRGGPSKYSSSSNRIASLMGNANTSVN